MYQKVKEVAKLFKAMDNDLVRFKKVTGVACPQGCILCCLKTGLEASVLEFFPLAWHLVRSRQYEGVLQQIESGQPVCISLNTVCSDVTVPGCRFYNHRGAICRLFGSAALRYGKSGKLSLYSCRTLKDNYADDWGEMESLINRDKKAPVVSDYYFKLLAIDPYLANDYNPINQSIYKAIGKVLLYYSYRQKPGADLVQRFNPALFS